MSNPTPKAEEDLPSNFSYPIVESLPLEKPETFTPVDFWEVLNNRRSSRVFRSLSLKEISNILWASAKVKELSVQNNNYILTTRPSASAGARHPIDILLLSSTLDNFKHLYYYNPLEHSLNRLKLDGDVTEKFKNHIASIINIENSTVLWFVAHPDRTEAKYDHATSLIWRDAGALIHSVQLACAGNNVNSCPVGTLGEPYISRMFADCGTVYGTGGVIIG